MSEISPVNLWLASTSAYRRQLLMRFGLPFECAKPEADETALPSETAPALSVRLARCKAEAVAIHQPMAWVIGSDQTADCEGRIVGKPEHHAAAVAQLQAMSGRAVDFFTAVCLAGPDGQRLEALDHTRVLFRTLGDDEIERYLRAEQPYDCAGSFKSEGLGVVLFDAIECRDPTALIGLPLIATAGLLRAAGFRLP